MIPLNQQIAEVRRELAMRSQVYPGLVAKKKMRQGEADMHVARMTAALKSLEWLYEHDGVLRTSVDVRCTVCHATLMELVFEQDEPESDGDDDYE